MRYIHLNPLRAGIVRDISGLNRYKWSGHSVIVGQTKNEWQSTEELLGRFGNRRGEAIKKYIEFIKDGEKMGKRDDLTGGGLRRSAGGWAGVFELRRNKEYWRSDERILGDGNFVSSVLKISDEEMVKKERLLRDGWDLKKIISRACEIMGIKGSELATYFGITKQSIGEAIVRGARVAKEGNHNLTT